MREEMTGMRGFLCEDTAEGIFTGVYDAWASGLGHEHVRLFLKGQYEPELFTEYVETEPDHEKAEKVARSVRRKISPDAFRTVYRTAMSVRADKAELIYRFLIEGFHYGADVMRMLSRPAVSRILDAAGRVANEAHKFLEFIRFEQLESGILAAVIAPKSNVLTLVAPHFEARFSGENWIIYDKTRKRAAIHRALESYLLMELDSRQEERLLKEHGKKDGYGDLWKVFFQSVAIESRKNERCQRNFLPLWYRTHMTEFL